MDGGSSVVRDLAAGLWLVLCAMTAVVGWFLAAARLESEEEPTSGSFIKGISVVVVVVAVAVAVAVAFHASREDSIKCLAGLPGAVILVGALLSVLLVDRAVICYERDSMTD